MPRKIIGPPARGVFYRGPIHDSPATNAACRNAGLPLGSSIGAILEKALINKAISGDTAAQRIVSEWKAPEHTDSEICPTCAKRPPIVFKCIWDEPENKNKPAPEHELIELLLHFIPPKIARPAAAAYAQVKFGVAEYYWAGSDGEKRKPPELVQQMVFGLVSWLRGEKQWEEFLAMMGEAKNV